MKIVRKVIILALVVVVFIFFGVYVFVGVTGKSILSQSLSKKIGKEVQIGSFYIMPPYVISIGNLEIKDLISVERIKLEPSISGLLAGRFGINKLVLIRPKLSLERLDYSRFNFHETIDYIKSKRETAERKSRVDFFVKEAIIEEGEISFDDRVAGLSFSIVPLEASVITSLKDFKTRVNLEAPVVSSDKRELGRLSANGWLNFLKKDMDAELHFSDAEIVYFSPYFKNLVKKVKSGKLFFTATMVSQDNDLNINCHLETRGLKFSDEESLLIDSQEKKIALFGNIAGVFFDTLIGPAGGGIFDFSIRTKFDRPRLEGLQFEGNIFQRPLENIFRRGPEEGVEAIKKIGKDFEAVGKKFKEQFEDIGEIFKKQSDESVKQTDAEISSTQEKAPVETVQ